MRLQIPTHRGLTTVEMLLVGAIGLALVVLLLPALADARHKARVARCTSNLRQLGKAFALYAQDYGELPNPIRLVRSIPNPEILACPEDDGKLREASSYVFRSLLPPDFEPVWEREALDPRTVLVLCNRHLGPRAEAGKQTTTLMKFPFKLVLRANGSVEQVHHQAVREVLVPGDRPTYANVYPGEQFYSQARR